MSMQDWIFLIIVGGLFGMVGQGVRVIVGLKKLYDEALQKGTAFSQNFSSATLLFSLLIGFVAGVFGMINLVDDPTSLSLKKEQVMTLIGIGYAGSDFIEGFVKKHTPQFAGSSGGTAAQTENPEHPPVG